VLALAAVAAIAVAAALGWLLGGQLHGVATTPQPNADRLAAVGPIRLAVDGAWEPVAAAPALAAMRVRNLAVYAPVAGLPGRVWVARADADAQTLVPAAVRSRIAGPLSAHAKSRLAGAPAWTYAGLPLRDGGMLELTVLPTGAGVLLVGCEAAKAWWSTVAGCARSVRAVAGATLSPPAQNIAFRRRLPGVMTKLNAVRAGAARALHKARRPHGQAAAATRLAKAHTGAAKHLRPLAPAGGAAQRVVARLGASAAAYRALAAAANRHDRRRYKTARKRATRADRALRAALRRAVA
jgi:hypothetical protein